MAATTTEHVDVLIVANPCFGLDFASVSEIRSQSMEQRNRGAAVLLVSSLLSAVYFFRVIERIYFAAGPVAAAPDRSLPRPGVSLRLLGPVITLAAAVLLIGLFNGRLVTAVIRHALPEL